MRLGVVVLSATLLIPALPAGAQQPVALQFNAGRVTLVTRNAPIRTILAEWARLGGATVVNGERVAGPPVSLELTDVPERQALDVILRGVAGYMLAPRRAGSAGSSTFDRIMILPTSAAPQNSPPTVAAAGRRPVVPRPLIARPPEVPPDTAADIEIEDPNEADAPSQPGNTNVTPRVVGPPVVRQIPGAEPTEEEPDETNSGAATPGLTVISTPSNPFGRPPGSSATPGVIAPAPRPQQQQQQGPANRVQ
jgi:hypothetical protein